MATEITRVETKKAQGATASTVRDRSVDAAVRTQERLGMMLETLKANPNKVNAADALQLQDQLKMYEQYMRMIVSVQTTQQKISDQVVRMFKDMQG